MYHYTKGQKRSLCFYKFEPVDVVTGRVIYEGIDFVLAGAIPLEWRRIWYSDSQYKGLLGVGVHFCYDLHIEVFENHNICGLLWEDGRVLGFPTLSFEDVYYLREEKLTIRYFGDCFQVYAHQTNLTYIFSRWSPNYFKLTRIERNAVTSIELRLRGQTHNPPYHRWLWQGVLPPLVSLEQSQSAFAEHQPYRALWHTLQL